MYKNIFLLVILSLGLLISACVPGELSYDEAVKELDKLTNRVSWEEDYIKQGEEMESYKGADLSKTLPDIDKYPITVEPYTVGNEAVVEIFVSTEKAGKDEPDNWMTLMAEDFNKKNITLRNGKTGKIRIRSIASGTAYQYIASGKYTPDAYSPSNHLWINMVEAQGVRITSISEELVDNTAGIVMKQSIYKDMEKNMEKWM